MFYSGQMPRIILFVKAFEVARDISYGPQASKLSDPQSEVLWEKVFARQ
jgi:hypothetical protein